MRSDPSLLSSRRCGSDHVREGSIAGYPAETARLPFSEVVLNAPFAWFAEDAPRLPTGARHHGHIRELLMRVLGPVAATKGLDKPDDFASFFETGVHERHVNEMRKQRTAGDEQVPAWNQNPESPFGKRCKKRLELSAIRRGEDRKARHGAALATVKRRRDSPDAALPAAQLLFFRVRVFLQPIRWIGDNRVNVVRRAKIHPLQTVRLIQRIAGAANPAMYRATLRTVPASGVHLFIDYNTILFPEVPGNPGRGEEGVPCRAP